MLLHLENSSINLTGDQYSWERSRMITKKMKKVYHPKNFALGIKRLRDYYEVKHLIKQKKSYNILTYRVDVP